MGSNAVVSTGKLMLLLVMMLVVLLNMYNTVCGQVANDTNNSTECDCLNGVCSRSRQAAVLCICDSHWEGDLCDQEKDRCAGNPCSDVNARCENSQDGFACPCKPGFIIGADGSCEESKIWSDFMTADAHGVLEGSSDPSRPVHLTLQAEYPIPFFSFSTINIRITNHGYIQLGVSPDETRDLAIDRFMKSSWSAWPFYLAPYWTNFGFDSASSIWSAWPFYLAPYWTNFGFDSASSMSDVFVSKAFRHNDPDRNSSLLDYARSVVQSRDSDFDPLAAYAVTWSMALPHSCLQCDERATVQLVLVTDFQFTYSIITWQDLFSGTDLFGGPEVISGHSSPDGGYAPFDPKPRTRLVIPLFSSGDPTSGPMECVRKKQESQAGSNWEPTIKCPCQEKDVKLDFRFGPDSTSSTAEMQCYQAKFVSDGVKQACCYDLNSVYISGPPDAVWPVEEPPVQDSSIQAAKDFCCALNNVFCSWFYQSFPACDAGPVIKIASGSGYGSLHMVPFNRHAFTFNGWGEYIILQSGDMELQARTMRRGEGNTTYFSAYTFQSSSDTSAYQIYVGADGNLGHGWTGPTPADSSVFTIDESVTDSVTITVPGLSLKVEKQAGDSLAHTITLPDATMASGLAGNDSGLDSTDMWRVPGENMSLFDYLQPAPTTFDAVNIHEGFEPHTLPMHVAEILALFTDEDKRNQSEALCGEDVFCLQEFLLFEDTDQAATTALQQSRRLAEMFAAIDMKPLEFEPVLETRFTPMTITSSASIQLQVKSPPSEGVLFSLEGSFSTFEGVSIDENTVMFSNLSLTALRSLTYPQSLGFVAKDLSTNLTTTYWPRLFFCLCQEDAQCLHYGFDYVDKGGEITTRDENTVMFSNLSLTALRSLTYPQSLGFVAKDLSTNLTTTYWPRLFFCLCQEDAQCLHYGFDYVDKGGEITTRGNVIQVGCQCPHHGSPWPRVQGRYCETDLDVCTDCYNQTACDSSREEGFCDPCPEHMDGNGILCRDIDECHTNNGGCHQICTSTHSGATCSCRPGYQLNGTSCIEVNECVDTPGICNSTSQYCHNTAGSFECRCYGNGLGRNCVIAPYTYSGTLKLAPVSGQLWSDVSNNDNTDLRSRITQSLKTKLTSGASKVGDTENVFVEVSSFTNLQQRSRRAVDREPEVEAVFVIRSTEHLEESNINTALDIADCVSNCDMEGILVYSVPETHTGNLCSLASVNTCDQQTSECVETSNDLVHCRCLPGFEQSADSNVCQDIDECHTNAHNCSQLNACSNTFGSYMCACADGYYWDKMAEICTADSCQSSPCQAYWQCFITDAAPGYVCSPLTGSSSDGDDDADDWKLALIIVASVLGALCLCLLIAVICLAMRRRKTLEMDAYSNSRYSDVAGYPRQQGYNKRGSSTEMTEQTRNRNVYQNAPGRNGNFTQAYANSGYSNDRL
ncbi:fibrillin-1-like isoform x15 [Plakobranchus ocellatus]|uniref:Fibrillin-1-like isoform x15 n=1 Tax=Plakobranchus ocellatus TaxID=259542 RepID=A0AAV3Z8V0_9GAST|nr:fibrillin-1-like isoform x15 [Plakobranchus ocellatus]